MNELCTGISIVHLREISRRWQEIRKRDDGGERNPENDGG
jgi:hypothetical protein